jgi:D-psicose/D-tagatose/L-ribulose 3-epimerase
MRSRIWRNLWDDGMGLATRARAFMEGGIDAAAKAKTHH